MKTWRVSWETLDWAVLDRLRETFLAGKPAGTGYWTSRSDLENYDCTFGQRIAWKWQAVLRELRLRGWTPPAGPLLDWGCGSGIASRCVAEFFGPEHFRLLRVFDRSPLAMDFAVQEARAAFPGLPIESGHSLRLDGSLASGAAQAGARKKRETEHGSPSAGCSPRRSDGRGDRGQGNGERGEGWPVLRGSTAAEARGESGPTLDHNLSATGVGTETGHSVTNPEGRSLGSCASEIHDRAGSETGAPAVGTLVISHVLNELDEPGGRALRQTIDRAEAVLWVEPGTYAESRSLIELREALRQSFHIIAPCTHQAACGLRVPDNGRHWCHHFAQPPPNIMADPNWVRFAQRAGIDLRSLPYSFLVLERKGLRDPVPGLLPDGCSRIIGAPRFYKGFAKIFSCQADGVRDYTLQKRAAPELFKLLRRGNETVIRGRPCSLC